MKKKKIVDIKKNFSIFLENVKRNENSKGLFYIKDNIQIDDNKLIKYINGNFKEFYKNQYILGEGTLGLVKKTICLENNLEFAVKIIRSRDEEIIFQIKEEFNHLINIEHHNIIKVRELLVDKKKGKIYWVMEYFDSEELFQYIINQGNYNEKIAKNLFKQLWEGIKYLHSKGIIHRDLKPNNILVSLDGKILKITDFNIAKFFDSYNDYNKLKKDNYKMLTYTGTIAFNAPEKFEKKIYTELVDCWSAGCILYTMLVGKQPFYKEYWNDLIGQIKNNDFDKYCKEFLNLSEQAKYLINDLLKTNPNERLSPKEALNHDWFKFKGTIILDSCWDLINKNKIKLIKNRFQLKKNKSISFSYMGNDDLNIKRLYSNNLNLDFEII